MTEEYGKKKWREGDDMQGVMGRAARYQYLMMLLLRFLLKRLISFVLPSLLCLILLVMICLLAIFLL